MKLRDPDSLSLLFPWCTLTLRGKVQKGIAGGLSPEASFRAAGNWDRGGSDAHWPLVLTRIWELCSWLG